MSYSPSVVRGGHGQSGALASHSKRHFAENNPHTLVGLQKVKIQLEKEINKLEKQQATAVTNIANHQQAMKMTWRRLQQRHVGESPPLTRSKDSEHTASRPKHGLFHSKTKLYVSNTPNIYHPAVQGTDVESTGSALAAPPTSKEIGDAYARDSTRLPTSLAASHLNSPYISSPYNYRRDVHLHQNLQAKPRIETSLQQQWVVGAKGTNATVQRSGLVKTTPQQESLKLPPIISSSSQPQLVTSSNPIDKKTLLKASAAMGGDLSSHSSASFKEFYSNEQPKSQTHLMSPVHLDMPSRVQVNQVQDDDLEKDKNGLTKESGELTLAEQFEQIKHCRYIRRYHPDGTALEEYY